MPACRIPPPHIFRKRRARSTSARVPASALPTGAPSPFEKQTLMVSNGAAEIGHGGPCRDARVPDARSVEVNGEPACARRVGEGSRVARVEDAAARAVVGVLERDERRARVVVGVRLHAREQLLDAEEATRPGDDELHAAEHGRRADLVERDVCALADDDLVARPGLAGNRELVAHGPRWHEERGFLSGDCRHLALEGEHARVLPEDVVADGGVGHRAAHAGGRPRDGVAAKVNLARRALVGGAEGTGGRHRSADDTIEIDRSTAVRMSLRGLWMGAKWLNHSRTI